MKRAGVLIFLILFFNPFTFSQAPGYMGKRMVVSYANDFFIAGIGPRAHSYDPGINTSHSLNLEYVIRNRTMMGLSYKFFHTGVSMDHIFEEFGTDHSSGSTYTATYTYLPTPDVPMLITANCAGLGFKFFSRGTLAPVGKYKKFELQLFFYRLTYPSDAFIFQKDYGYAMEKASMVSLGSGNYSYKTFSLNYTMGNQRVLFDRFILDYGLQVGFLPAGFFGSLGTELEINSAESPELVFRQEANKRLFRYQLINFHLGLGFLAF